MRVRYISIINALLISKFQPNWTQDALFLQRVFKKSRPRDLTLYADRYVIAEFHVCGSNSPAKLIALKSDTIRKFELEKLWKTNIKIVPIIIGALGTVTKNLETHLKSIDLEEVKVHQLQKCVLLKTGNILQKHLWI